MSHFPVFIDLANRPVLVVGGGELAACKVRLLRRSGAKVTVVAPRLGHELAELVAADTVTHRARGFVAGDVNGQTLAIAATGRAEIDARVAEAARAAGIPVNAVDRRELSDFLVPAIIERDPIIVAVSSGGVAPVLARRLRERIEALLPSRLGELARFAERFRAAVMQVVPRRARRRFWELFFDGPVAQQVLAGDERGAREAMLAWVNGRREPHAGSVAIAGAGPGDPDLVTLRTLRLLHDADVVVHDPLVGEGVLELARRDAERIAVGDAPGEGAIGRNRVPEFLAERALAGQRVVRLELGDPAGAELTYLRRRGIAATLVPGVAARLAFGSELGATAAEGQCA